MGPLSVYSPPLGNTDTNTAYLMGFTGKLKIRYALRLLFDMQTALEMYFLDKSDYRG